MVDQQPGSGEVRTTPWAIWALACGILGLCCFPIGLAGAAFGVVALVKMEKDKALGGKALAIAGLAVGASSVFINGILAAVAIPSFIQYTRRAKTAEVSSTIDVLYGALERQHQASGKIVPLPLTPSEVPCGNPHVWTAQELQRFAAIGYVPSTHTYFSYEITTDPEAVGEGVALIRARGDFDCDGTTSLFQLEVGEDAAGKLTRGPRIDFENETE